MFHAISSCFIKVKEFSCFITQLALGVQALCEHPHTQLHLKLAGRGQMNREMLPRQVKTVGVGVDRRALSVVFMRHVSCFQRFHHRAQVNFKRVRLKLHVQAQYRVFI